MIGETNVFSVSYEKRAMLVTMSHSPADKIKGLFKINEYDISSVIIFKAK